MILYHCICYFCWNIACQCLTFKLYFCLNLTYPLFLARIDEQKVKYKKVEYPSKIEELFLFLSLLISSSLFSFILEVGVSRKDLGWNKSTLKNHWCFVFRENHFEEHLASVWRSIIHFFNDLELMKWLAKLFVNTFDRIFHEIIKYNEDLSIVNHLKTSYSKTRRWTIPLLHSILDKFPESSPVSFFLFCKFESKSLTCFVAI